MKKLTHKEKSIIKCRITEYVLKEIDHKEDILEKDLAEILIEMGLEYLKLSK